MTTIGMDRASVFAQSEPAMIVQCTESPQSIDVTVHGKPVLTYNKAFQEPPEGMDPIYRRSGYIHPLYTPSGRMVTGDFAPDHAHQHALFGAFVNTTFQGKRVDFWNQHKRTGNVSHHKVIEVHSGNDVGGFTVELLHEAFTTADPPTPVLKEQWKVQVHATTSPGFVIDIQSTITCIVESPLTINPYHYGGMAFRGNNQWVTAESEKAMNAYLKATEAGEKRTAPDLDVARHQFLTSKGERRFEGNGSHVKWVDLSGRVDDKLCGAAMLSHRENFRFPQAVRLHPSKPYFCFAPMVDGEFTLEPNETFASHYRYIAHDDAPDTAAIEQAWLEFTK
ncbi:hypothetical protein RMSM_07269 [Rhodopirellula maiorica SM1]|uniref:Uncharacterized protein n=1 Tax=Rhodopirellula maiorica SM1 TaxID=1265738 RepID=M5RPD2_9BACT|nr:hypothetical protein RMSM_07269 [Rhodopirellula maiorica SM1]